MNMTLEIG